MKLPNKLKISSKNASFLTNINTDKKENNLDTTLPLGNSNYNDSQLKDKIIGQTQTVAITINKAANLVNNKEI